MPCVHHWMVGSPTFTRQGDEIIEHTEQDCKKCHAHKTNWVVAVALPPDVVNLLDLPIEVLRGEYLTRSHRSYIDSRTGKPTKVRVAA